MNNTTAALFLIGLTCFATLTTVRSEVPAPTHNIPTEEIDGEQKTTLMSILQTRGEEAGCTVVRWNQGQSLRRMKEHLEMTDEEAEPLPWKGFCFGGALEWMTIRSQGKVTDAEFLDQMEDYENFPTFNKAVLLYRNQPFNSNDLEKNFQKMIHLKRSHDVDDNWTAEDEHGKSRSATFWGDLTRASLDHDSDQFQTTSLNQETDARGLVDWWAHTRNRYYLISVKGAKHAVAAANDRHGLSFFDPNAGILTCKKSLVGSSAAKKMTNALTWYFSHPKIREYYSFDHRKIGVKLEAAKYKPAKDSDKAFRGERVVLEPTSDPKYSSGFGNADGALQPNEGP